MVTRMLISEVAKMLIRSNLTTRESNYPLN